MADAWAELCAILDAQRYPPVIEGMDRWVDDGGPPEPETFVARVEGALGLEFETVAALGSIAALVLGARLPDPDLVGAQSIVIGYARRTLERAVSNFAPQKKGNRRS